jgi:hypothetical protein
VYDPLENQANWFFGPGFVTCSLTLV